MIVDLCGDIQVIKCNMSVTKDENDIKKRFIKKLVEELFNYKQRL